MRNISEKVVPIAATALVLAGCRTNKDILNDYEKDLVKGAYVHATAEVTEKSKKAGEDQLMWYLLAGGAEHLAGNPSTAIGNFDRAEDIFIDNDTQSVFSKGATGAYAMMTNDRVFPFAGGGQDRIFACLYKAIDYCAQRNVDAARTEFNRASQHQENWIYERRRDIDAARERMKKDSDAYAKENKIEAQKDASVVDNAFGNAEFAGQIKSKTGFDPAVDGNLDMLSQRDYMNVYAQHVCGVFRWLTDGNGRDYFRGLTDLAPSNTMLAADLRAASAGEKPNSQVWIYVEDGLCPCREEWRLDLPLALIPGLNRYVLYAGMAIPYLRYRAPACAGYSAVTAVGEQPLEVLQNLDSLLKVEHDVYMRGALAREIMRVVIKSGAQIALGVAAENAGGTAGTALRCSQLAAAAWAASVTQADLRSWTSLPKLVYACRVTRPADGKIVLKSVGSEVVTLDVPAGNSMVFVNKPASAAAPVVRVVSL